MKTIKWLFVLLYSAAIVSILYGMLQYWLGVSVFTFQSTIVTAALHIAVVVAMLTILKSLIQWRIA